MAVTAGYAGAKCIFYYAVIHVGVGPWVLVNGRCTGIVQVKPAGRHQVNVFVAAMPADIERYVYKRRRRRRSKIQID